MDNLKEHLVTKGLDFIALPKNIQNLIIRADQNYKNIPEKKKPEFIEKFINILADAENNLDKLSSEIEFQNYIIKAENMAVMVETNIESKEAYEIRNRLYEIAGIDKNPSRNGVTSQILMAVIDEFIVSIGDMAIEIYKTLDEKGGTYILTEIKNTILSGNTWTMIVKELGNGLGNMLFDWDTGKDDFIYKKTRSLLIAAGLAVLIKSIGKKIIKSIAKNAFKKVDV